MRQMTYTRELERCGYVVLGCDVDYDEYGCSVECKPIRMKLTKARNASVELQETLWQRVLRYTDSDLFDDPDSVDFTENHVAIMKGERPDWQLDGFRVFVGGVILYYSNTETLQQAFLWISGLSGLDLEFKCPKNRLGFEPTYQVWTDKTEATINEDFGYIRNEVILKLKDPAKTDDNFVHDGNTIAEITEYAGI